MLTALELTGFKSFADKTRLDIPAGVTCVVGPNGSGKSNVVDAVKWVLGSQSPKALRGSEMTDVIFNGASGRRPLNTAEVTLEFDNRSGLFELKEPTVRITRRVYRSGEGEYAINGAACRLRDIRQLLAGTGVGAESYNIIEQGRVDAVLRASPKDRRALFEEAAGISRFRLKKQEAARRLARVEQNLLRLSDIVDEVEGRLRRVRMQAGKARRYREQSDRLQELRTQLGLADWRVLTARLEELEHVRTRLASQGQQQAEQIEQGDAHLQKLEQHTDTSAEELAAVERKLSATRELLAARQSEVASNTDRLAELEDALMHARRRLVATRIEARSRSDGVSVSDLESRLADQRQSLAAAQQTAAGAERALHEHRRKLQTFLAEQKQYSSRRQACEEELAAAQREADRVQVRLEVAQSQLAEHEPLLERIAQQRGDAAEQLERSRRQLNELRGRLTQASEEAGVARVQAEQFRDRLASERERSAQQEAEAASDRRQLAVLKAADQQLDRLREEIVRLLPPVADGRPQAIVHGLVADVMHVDFDTAPMIEAALGERAHHLVVDDGAALLDALDSDHQPLRTRASFERMDAKLPGAAIDQIDLSGELGVMGRADQFVEAEAEYLPLVERMLGRTWIVDTLATAKRLIGANGKGLSFVTFDGEAISADGCITVGEQGESAGVLMRRRQMAMLREHLAESEQRQLEVSQEVESLQRDTAAAAEQADRLQAEKATLTARLAELGQQVAKLSERHDRLNEEHDRVAEERAKQATLVSSTEAIVSNSQAEREELSYELLRLDGRLAAIAEQISNAESSEASLQAEAHDAKLLISRHDQHVEILSEQLTQLKRDTSERGSVDREAATEVATLVERTRLCALSLLHGRGQISTLQLEVQELATHQKQMAARRRSGANQRQELARRLHEARRAAESTRSQLQQAELDAERLRLERTALANRMQEDYGIDLAEAAHEAPAAEPEDRASLEQELSMLRGQVGSVSAVNLDSLEELDQLEERFAQLSSQYNDLSEAKTSLERLSTRISTESRQLFLATVDEVRGHFRELFRRLFGGGEADIIMLEEAEGADPLDAGVEIAVSPPGKELRSISLMSGGEKTLTCVALLLAVFRTKPSPFCVLDEVDAALDESNVGRFTGVLSEFLSSTQFIVVTHSKKTMTGADTLYGVTMQESGISKQVSVRFEDVGEDGQIRPAATLRRQTPPSQAA